MSTDVVAAAGAVRVPERDLLRLTRRGDDHILFSRGTGERRALQLPVGTVLQFYGDGGGVLLSPESSHAQWCRTILDKSLWLASVAPGVAARSYVFDNAKKTSAWLDEAVKRFESKLYKDAALGVCFTCEVYWYEVRADDWSLAWWSLPHLLYRLTAEVPKRENAVAELQSHISTHMARHGFDQCHVQSSAHSQKAVVVARQQTFAFGQYSHLAQEFCISSECLVVMLLVWARLGKIPGHRNLGEDSCENILMGLACAFCADDYIFLVDPKQPCGGIRVDFVDGIAATDTSFARLEIASRWQRVFVDDQALDLAGVLGRLEDIVQVPSRHSPIVREYALVSLRGWVERITININASRDDKMWSHSFVSLKPLPSRKRCRRVSPAYKRDLTKAIAENPKLRKVSHFLASAALQAEVDGDDSAHLSDRAGARFTQNTMFQYYCTSIREQEAPKQVITSFDGVKVAGEETVTVLNKVHKGYTSWMPPAVPLRTTTCLEQRRLGSVLIKGV